jgi:hypothetical protein
MFRQLDCITNMQHLIMFFTILFPLTGCIESRPEGAASDAAPGTTTDPTMMEPGEVQCQYEYKLTRVSADVKTVVTSRYALISGIPMDSNYCVKTAYAGAYLAGECRPSAGCTETGAPLPSSAFYSCRSGSFSDAGQLILSCGQKIVQTTNGVETVSDYIIRNTLYR